MCGILGYIGGNQSTRDNFDNALDLLEHRGPDDSGVFKKNEIILGHRRLSILDLSKEGHQPLIDEVNNNVIVFNGEIYNYIELRESLDKLGYVFKSHCDTEVLLYSYKEWGEGCLDKLNGMFSFSIYDPSLNQIFFARDRFGVKPYYYALREGDFAFASEPKAIIGLDRYYSEPDIHTIYEFLQFGSLHNSENSFYKNIKTLLPAHCGRFHIQTKTFKTWRYWDYPEQENAIESSEELELKLGKLFDESVALRMRSDVPVGLTLSGGIDSTCILSSVSRNTNEGVSCFTSVYSGSERSERDWARLACEKSSTETVLHEIEANKDEWLAELKKIVWHMDGPGFSPAVYPVWQIMKNARKMRVPVLLEGQGADELFGGYLHYSIISFLKSIGDVLRLKEKLSLGVLAQEWSAIVDTFGMKASVLWLFRQSFPFMLKVNRRKNAAGQTMKKEVIQGYENLARAQLKERVFYPEDPVSQQLFVDHSRQLLPGLLHYGDAISMAHSIEARQPFLDYRLVEAVFKLQAKKKILKGKTKWILRNYLVKAGQEAIANRKDKTGYLTPVDSWMAQNDCKLLKEYLLSEESKILEICEKDKVEALINRFKKGKFALGNHVYRLLTTEIWLRSLA